MLIELKQLPDSVKVLIVYISDDRMLHEIQKSISSNTVYDINYIVDVAQATAWQRYQKETHYRPMLGDKWLLRVNIDDITIDTVMRNLLHTGEKCMSILYTHKYNIYSKIVKLENVRNNKLMIRTVYGARLTSKDMYVRYNEEIGGGKQELTPPVLNYVVQQYARDPLKFFKLLDILKSGQVINSRTDVVRAVGLGAMSVDKLLLDMMRTDIKTARGAKIAVKRWEQMLYDLLQAYSAHSIIQQMQQLIEDAYYLKLCQVDGKVVGNRCEIPENKMTYGVRRLLNYGNYFWDNCSLPMLLWLKTQLCNANSNAEVELTMLLYAVAAMAEQKYLCE